MLDVTQDRSVIDSVEMDFECPACKMKSLTDLFRFRTREKLLGLITLKITEETAVRCPACASSFRSSFSIPALGELSESEASSAFRIRISFPDKFLVVAGWVLFVFFPVSFVLFLISFFRLPRAAKGWRRANLIGLTITGIVTMIVFLAMAIEQWGARL